jgi:3-deoxy-D-manno-octulosonic-acid transferase
MMFARLGYRLLLWGLLPQALLHLWWRSRRQPAYREHIGERFGRYHFKVEPPLIWVHAVSVGETRAAEPLINALIARYPGHRILLTHMTPTGRETGVALFGDKVARCYLPYDFPFAVEGFIDHFRPVCGILLETEIWPNLIDACNRRDIPAYLVNARLSDKSFRRYQRFGALAADALRGLSAVAAQSEDDAVRFRALGATAVTITGNVKFEIPSAPALIARGTAWRAQYGDGRRVLLLASTREGEEALLLDVLRGIDDPKLLVLLVPRHPQRFDEVAALLAQRAIAYQRRSSEQAIAPATRVLLGDSMGEMAAYFAASDVVIMGGSLLPFGAHNLIEACALGKPVIVGPHDYNFAEAVRLAVAAGAALQVADATQAVATAMALLNDAPRYQRMAEAGLAFVRAHAGATQRVIDLIRLRS